MIRLHHASFSDIAPPSSPGLGLLQRLRRHVARVETAMAGQARLAALPSATVRDTGLSPCDLTDAPSHDPALPFFLQANFARRDR